MYPSCPTTNYYLVAEGDTLASIAGYFGISAEQLQYSSYGIDSKALYKDQVICIPVTPPPVKVSINAAARTLIVYRDCEAYKPIK